MGIDWRMVGTIALGILAAGVILAVLGSVTKSS